MNQILLTSNDNNKNKGNNRTINNSNDIKKIIMFFAVVILVFGIAIGGIYGYKVFKKDKVEVNNNLKISIKDTEEGAEEVVIIAEAEVGISKIIYIWNDEEQTIKEISGGRTKQEETIEIPFGTNTLKVKVVDQNGQETEQIKEFVRETEGEIITEESIIEIDDAIGNGQVKIVVADEESKIEYMKYRWNEEEETTIEAEDGEETIEVIIDVKRGKNILTVTAVNSDDEEITIEKTLKGVKNPEISVKNVDNILYMKITHDMGLKEVEFNINGKKYIYDENYSGYDSEKKELEYKIEIKEGETGTVIIKAVSNETRETKEGLINTEYIFRGKY